MILKILKKKHVRDDTCHLLLECVEENFIQIGLEETSIFNYGCISERLLPA